MGGGRMLHNGLLDEVRNAARQRATVVRFADRRCGRETEFKVRNMEERDGYVLLACLLYGTVRYDRMRRIGSWDYEALV